jgi:hypothetical protein
LLVAGPLDGERLVSSQFRPRAGANRAHGPPQRPEPQKMNHCEPALLPHVKMPAEPDSLTHLSVPAWRGFLGWPRLAGEDPRGTGAKKGGADGCQPRRVTTALVHSVVCSSGSGPAVKAVGRES